MNINPNAMVFLCSRFIDCTIALPCASPRRRPLFWMTCCLKGISQQTCFNHMSACTILFLSSLACDARSMSSNCAVQTQFTPPRLPATCAHRTRQWTNRQHRAVSTHLGVLPHWSPLVPRPSVPQCWCCKRGRRAPGGR